MLRLTLVNMPFSSLRFPSFAISQLRADVEEAARDRRLPTAEAVAMAAASWVMASPGRYAAAQRAGRAGRALGRQGRIRRLPPPLSAWTAARDAPAPPAQTFREWWQHEHGNADGSAG